MNKALRDACRTPLENERVRSPFPSTITRRQATATATATYMKAIEEAACPGHMCIRAGRAHPPHIPVFDPHTPALPVRKVGPGDGVEVGEQVPAPRLLALPRRVQGDRVRGRYGVAVVLAVLVARDDGPHDDVQRDACVTDAECTFEDDLTLQMDRSDPFWRKKRGGTAVCTMILYARTISCSVIGVRRDNSQ